jgi:hypothetical protein
MKKQIKIYLRFYLIRYLFSNEILDFFIYNISDHFLNYYMELVMHIFFYVCGHEYFLRNEVQVIIVIANICFLNYSCFLFNKLFFS